MDCLHEDWLHKDCQGESRHCVQACSGKVTSTWGNNRDKKGQCRKETNYKMKAGCGEEEGRKKGQEERRGGRLEEGGKKEEKEDG